jgi:hypothetical protein
MTRSHPGSLEGKLQSMMMVLINIDGKMTIIVTRKQNIPPSFHRYQKVLGGLGSILREAVGWRKNTRPLLNS